MINSIQVVANSSNNLLATSVVEVFLKGDTKKVSLAENFEEALHILKKENYDLSLIFVPKFGVRFLAKLEKVSSMKRKIILIFNSDDKFSMHQIVNLSVDGLISTNDSYADLMSAIKVITTRNLKYISPLLVSSIPNILSRKERFSFLSRKEVDVAFSIIEGKRNSDIAVELNISPKTVSTYKARIFRKLKIENEIELFKYAQKSDIEPL